eukprot:368588-Amphidinium_carterae.1
MAFVGIRQAVGSVGKDWTVALCMMPHLLRLRARAANLQRLWGCIPPINDCPSLIRFNLSP